jgi:hypothetical protein
MIFLSKKKREETTRKKNSLFSPIPRIMFSSILFISCFYKHVMLSYFF